jgi:type I restriction-modification system DNA methylase subunit
MLFHDILDAQIENGDTRNEPKHIEGAELKRFDIVIANPPFSQNYSADTMRPDVQRALSLLDAHQGESGLHVCPA